MLIDNKYFGLLGGDNASDWEKAVTDTIPCCNVNKSKSLFSYTPENYYK